MKLLFSSLDDTSSLRNLSYQFCNFCWVWAGTYDWHNKPVCSADLLYALVNLNAYKKAKFEAIWILWWLEPSFKISAKNQTEKTNLPSTWSWLAVAASAPAAGVKAVACWRQVTWRCPCDMARGPKAQWYWFQTPLLINKLAGNSIVSSCSLSQLLRLYPRIQAKQYNNSFIHI